MATRSIKPPAQLKPRNRFERSVSDAQSAGGNEITYEQLKSISIFKDVKYERIDLRVLPDTIVLRRFEAGEQICEQDHPGYTAFYVLTESETAVLKLPSLPDSAVPRDQVIQVTRTLPSRTNRMKEMVTDTVLMGEGELFGEMSCLYRIPRSATVRATRACYVLEFLRNVLDKINTGPFRNQLDEIFRTRFLEMHLRHLELFKNLSNADYLRIRDGIELKSLMPSEVLFDEHDRPDGMYIIRSGFVKIVKGVSALLGKESIPDWAAFLAALAAGSGEGGARSKLWTLIEKSASPDSELLYAINDLLKKKEFAAQIGFEFIGPAAVWGEQAKKFAAAKNPDPTDVRLFNRHLLESLYPNVIAAYGIDPPRVVAYRTSPEWIGSAGFADASSADSSLIGEIAMRRGCPRTATCIAYGQSDDRYGGVRLVYINAKLYDELVKKATHPAAKQNISRVEDVAGARARQDISRMSLPVWQQESVNRQFEDLGLIQGQKLMLIDLDRCTRCDKCVEACVESHTPSWMAQLPIVGPLLGKLPIFANTGPLDRRSRLFLDGPRIQLFDDDEIKNYLVPSTCRQCKDPVCLIGCPVGSIHKGDNGQIVIEDWCIGCSRCALNCPYNAIQMHTIGIIARSSIGWRRRQANRAWIDAATPFRNSRDLHVWYKRGTPIEFTHRFDLPAEETRKSKTFLLHVESSATAVTVEVNGITVDLWQLDAKEAKQKGWNWEATVTHLDDKSLNIFAGDKPPKQCLRLGSNEIAIMLPLPDAPDGEVLLDVGLTGYVLPIVDKTVAGDEFKQDLVMNSAVVCDMCSGQFGQQPACVTACPHEAAERRFITYDTFLPAR